MAKEFSFKRKNTNEFIGFQFEKREDGSVEFTKRPMSRSF
jgi:hypothetical protein